MSWEVAQICEICKANEWIMPTVYQGGYHALQRSIEDELFPCLRKYGISLYAFQPLAGGLLTGRYTRNQTQFDEGSRFDPKILQGTVHRNRYWNDAYFDAIESLHSAAVKYEITDAEVALRWLKHHSQVQKDLDDAIIVGQAVSGISRGIWLIWRRGLCQMKLWRPWRMRGFWSKVLRLNTGISVILHCLQGPF
jgi:aflatoxin B1 aldehyde reductase